MKVAVYGTLRKGFGNHRILEGLLPLREGFVSVPFRMVSLGGFPGLIPASEHHQVYLEIYDIGDDTERLRRLDGLEGYRGPNQSNFYDRITIPDFQIDGEGVEVYVLDESYADHASVDNGDWAEYRSQRRGW